VGRLAHAATLESPQITADVVEIGEFPDLGRAYGVRSVPLTVINEYTRFAGVVTEAEFVQRLLAVGVRGTEEPPAEPKPRPH